MTFNGGKESKAKQRQRAGLYVMIKARHALFTSCVSEGGGSSSPLQNVPGPTNSYGSPEHRHLANRPG